MTNEERERAISYFERRKEMGLSDNCQDMENLAIEALKAEPCDDCASRDSLLENVRAVKIDGKYQHVIFWNDIKALPPVTPKQKTGKWRKAAGLYGCPFCSLVTNYNGYEFYDYCPNCGAKLEKEEKDE